MGPRWPALVRQWEVARAGIGDLGRHNDSVLGVSQLDPWYFFNERGLGGVYMLHRGTCRAAVNGTELVYVRIYKSANNDICANLHALPRDATRPRGRIVFTFVREPLEHFESGYSEIVQRSGHQRYDKEYRDPSTLYTFTRYAHTNQEKAFAFVRDLLGGRLRRSLPAPSVTDVHVFPQVAAISRALDARRGPPEPRLTSNHLAEHTSILPAVHFVGRLEQLHHDWAALGRRVRGGLPPFTDKREDHTKTDQRSMEKGENPARAAMHAILRAASGGNATFTSAHPEAARRQLVYAVALCRVLLPDYVCFGIPLPPECARAIGPSHGVTCDPLRVQLPPPPQWTRSAQSRRRH